MARSLASWTTSKSRRAERPLRRRGRRTTHATRCRLAWTRALRVYEAAATPVRRGCRISRARRPASERRRGMAVLRASRRSPRQISRREADLLTLPSIYATASGERSSALVCAAYPCRMPRSWNAIAAARLLLSTDAGARREGVARRRTPGRRPERVSRRDRRHTRTGKRTDRDLRSPGERARGRTVSVRALRPVRRKPKRSH
jgi:hypothetical protein